MTSIVIVIESITIELTYRQFDKLNTYFSSVDHSEPQKLLNNMKPEFWLTFEP